jgi:hypothetical protein
MGSVRPAGTGFFPLDDELALLPGSLTPLLQEQLVRLGTWMPFAPAAALLADFMRLSSVSASTARRHTEAAGMVWVTEQTQTVDAYERRPPPLPDGPDKLVLSADGAMVPLMDGSWAEVKTLAIGEVSPLVTVKGEPVVHTTALSYFSRLTDSDTFARLALVETHRRGVESARAVAAVSDGAEWLQGFIDYHRRDAVRVLDFPHAAEYLSTIGAATLGDGQSPPPEWFSTQLHRLKQDGPATVLMDLRALQTTYPNVPGVSEALAYLEKREALMQYPAFQAAGWPIGSGCVESANKLVVEARLKGSGMHWQRASVNPMLALRNLVCNDRWQEAWPSIAQACRQHALIHQQTHRAKRRARLKAAAAALVPSVPSNTPPPIATTAPASPSPTPAAPRRPAADHPWRRMSIGKARFQPKPSLH